MGCQQSIAITTSAAATMSETPTTEKVKVATVDPAAVLNATSIAKTLTISDQHATILLTTKTAGSGDGGDDDSDEKKALLKLTLVPFHKADLLPPRPPNDQEEKAKQSEKETQAQLERDEQDHSKKVLTFLSQFDWKMTSESGAEYSFHEAFPKTTVADNGGENETKEPALKKSKKEETTGDERKTTAPAKTGVFKAELIYPASDRQLARAMPNPGFAMVVETPAVYQAVTKPFIDGIVASGSLSWLQNIVQVKKEQERLLWNADHWILNIDTKWRSHPPALTVPRQEWYQHESTADLYCLGIFKEDGVASLRDLTGKHLPILREMLDQGPKVIEQVYGVPKDQLRIFVHYQPQFYHFHVHYTRLENDTGAQVQKAHLLSDIIQDLEADPDCFQKKRMTYKLSLKEKLYHLLKAHESEREEK